MGEGEARTTATKEVETAQQMMAKNDIEDVRATSTAPWKRQRNRCLVGAPEGVGGGGMVALVRLRGMIASTPNWYLSAT
jgi:hypothetical protein